MFKTGLFVTERGIITNDICVKIGVKLKTIVRNRNTLVLNNDVI